MKKSLFKLKSLLDWLKYFKIITYLKLFFINKCIRNIFVYPSKWMNIVYKILLGYDLFFQALKANFNSSMSNYFIGSMSFMNLWFKQCIQI